MNVEQLQEQVIRFTNNANRLRRVIYAFTATIYGGAAVLGYGVIDSIAEQELNIESTALSATIIYGSAVLSLASKTCESMTRNTADYLRKEINNTNRNNRLRNYEELKHIGLSSRFSTYRFYR